MIRICIRKIILNLNAQNKGSAHFLLFFIIYGCNFVGKF